MELRTAPSRVVFYLTWADHLDKALEHLASNDMQAVLVGLGSRDAIVAGLRATLQAVIQNPQMLCPMQQCAMQRVRTLFTWDVKAQQVLEVYDWVLGRRNKPRFDADFLDQPELAAV